MRPTMDVTASSKENRDFEEILDSLMEGQVVTNRGTNMECDDSDRFLISVKPPDLLFESKFVDVDKEDREESIQINVRDPISEDNEDAHSECFPPVERILPVRDEDVFPQLGHESERMKVVAIDSNLPKTCLMCYKNAIPTHQIQDRTYSYSVCSDQCWSDFIGLETMSQRFRIALFKLNMQKHKAKEYSARKCVNCKKSLYSESYLAWETLEFCSGRCLAVFQRSVNTKCPTCSQIMAPDVVGKYCACFGATIRNFCKRSCLVKYKNLPTLCLHCHEEDASPFCSERCKAEKTKTTPSAEQGSAHCSVCSELKDVKLQILHNEMMANVCSNRCMVAYEFVHHIELIKCEMCPKSFEKKSGYPMVVTPAKVHHLCSQACKKAFIIAVRIVDRCVICRAKKYNFDMIECIEQKRTISACSLHCLNMYHEANYSRMANSVKSDLNRLEDIATEHDLNVHGEKIRALIEAYWNSGKIAVRRIIVRKPRHRNRQKNKAVMCKPRVLTKGIQCNAFESTIGIQTDDQDTCWIPIPVPIYVPLPLHMFIQPVPVLTPIPLPLIVPIFIRTGRKSMKGVKKEMHKIKCRIPANPLEAEILLMADMAAGVKRSDNSSDSETDASNKIAEPVIGIDAASTSFNEDVLSIAMKMANDYPEPLDLESEVDNSTRMLVKRPSPMYKNRGRQQPRMLEMASSKPDENLALKFSFGVNAWKQWATMKNHELQKIKINKFVKMDLLQLSAEDLCYCLCQFVKEVRKPNGAQYASDTIYYLCLGIQLYLYENGRIDNLFCDPYYEKFTDSFNDICLSFCQLYTKNQYIVTRVEEEHLWESKQLGAHSPLVLLNTLLFFNTKHFNLTTVEDHLQLSFSHIMKHWKRNANAPSQRNVLLRFYPPQKSAWGRRKVYEQQECIENPLRCPVRLYEFFLSKCPESVKTRNDVFYLQPERSCVPDSPVWYSTMALDQKQLEKMLNRMKMIKEISMAILGT